MSREPEVVGSKIEMMLQKELGTSATIRWEVDGEGRKTTLKDGLTAAFGGKLKGAEYKLTYELPGHRRARIQVGIIFAGIIGWLPGALYYTSALTPLIQNAVWLNKTEPLISAFGWNWPNKASFAGDPSVCGKLNRRTDIVAHTSKLMVSKGESGNIKVTIPASASILPTQAGSELALLTLPILSGFGKHRFQVKEFLELAKVLEATL